MNRQTTLAKNDDFPRHWVHVDAKGQVLGRLAAEIAFILQGKNKPTYTNHHDVGDFVVVTNAKDVVVTGTKLDDKFHERYSGHPSGRKITTWREVLDGKHPERLLETAVRRMMPKSRLGRAQFKKLKVYAGDEHPHTAQAPKPLELQTA
ncbi:MAG: 50S ribosomal protein L13 [Planctomycetota bacterium]